MALERLGAVLILVSLGVIPAAADPLDTIRELEWQRGDPASIVALLASEEAPVRAAAARALGRLKAQTQRPAIIGALASEPEAEVRRWLIFALGQLPGAADALTDLLAQRGPFEGQGTLTSTDEAHALTALGKIAGPAQSLLLKERLNHEAAEVRSAAAIALALMSRREKDASPELRAEVTRSLLQRLPLEESAEVRWSVAYALVELAAVPSARLPGALEGLLSAEEDERTRAFAARALAARAKALGDAAAASIEDPDGQAEARRVTLGEAPAALRARTAWPWRAGVEVVRALRHYDTVEASLALVRLIEHASFHVRRAAIAALAERAERLPETLRPRVEASLRGCIASDLWETVRAEALVALVTLRQRETLELIEAALKGDVTARKAAARALAALEDSKGTNAWLQDLRSDEDARVRLSAIEAFASRPGPEGFMTAMAGLGDPAVAVAGTALMALSERDDGPQALPQLLERYRRDRSDPACTELREILCASAGKLAKGLAAESDERSAAMTLLSEATRDPQPSVRAAAATSLEALTGSRPEVEGGGEDSRRPAFPIPTGRPRILVRTSRGRFVVELFADIAPLHVGNILHLITRNGSPRSPHPERSFYDGLTWHRVVSHFVIQGGCPNGDGWGDPGWMLPDELSDLPYRHGTLGMPKAGDDTGGCQLFFCHGPTPHLEGRYTVFGQVIEGSDVIDRIEEGDGILELRVWEGEGR